MHHRYGAPAHDLGNSSVIGDRIMSIERTDVAIIGGGYYGAFVANEIKTLNPDLDVTVVEKEDAPFTKASSTNQGQFHMGYMYSGNKALAGECVENIARFSSSFGEAVDGEVVSLYGIHQDSEVGICEYVRFCEEMGLPLELIDRPADIFGDTVAAAFKSAEKTFNSATVQRILAEKIALKGIRLMTGFDVRSVHEGPTGIRVMNTERSLKASHVFNVTFADINGLHERSGLPGIPLRYDTFLHFVLDLPGEYRNTAATVIRGPYASLLPSSFRQGHVLASGQYRRVRSSTTTEKPSEAIRDHDVKTVYDLAVDEAIPYLPVLGLARFLGHTIGTRAAHLDPQTGAYTSKAIVFENFGDMANYHAVLGGKVSCMFDVANAVETIISRPA
jgi:glycine/D-amino acid oxidase-like deaminating enzyme